jgi:hypothetical protein
MMDKIDYKKLKKDLLRKVGTSGNMALIVTVDSASEKKLLRLAEEFSLNISDYVKVE